ncbi:MAG: hypothetical protein ABI990_08295 [Actinomycetota bacterium]
MAQASIAHRRTSAREAATRAKRRRSKALVIGLGVVLAALLAFQLPKTLKLLNGSSSSAATPPSTATPSATRSAAKKVPAILRGTGSGTDPFAARALPDLDPRVGLGGGRDPFATQLAAAPAVSVTAPALPKRLVIGTPGAHKRVTHGWIVILASIPVQRGHASAAAFARRIHGLGALSILNSSNRRPLRGGYWVVYAGPVKRLTAVSLLAAAVHAAGYTSAYIRELYEYR